MDLQILIVILIVSAAVGYAARSVYRRARSMRAKPDCEAGCGCEGGRKKVTS